MVKQPLSALSFEAAIKQLEVIVQNMEAGELPLEQALDQYQKGVELLKHCRKTLTQAEQRIRKLEGDVLVEARLDERQGTDEA